MQTQLSEEFKHSSVAQQADDILRSCVHCGFCTATCPTYLQLGDELDGPRGRIYLIKQVLEGQPATRKTQQHLDRCLTCRSCETTCPSSVNYHRLLDIGRQIVEQKVSRPFLQKTFRFVLRKFLLHNFLFNASIQLNRLLAPLLPHVFSRSIQKQSLQSNTARLIKNQYKRKVLLLEGCVQPSLQPHINQHTRQVLSHLDIGVIDCSAVHCCGALSHHLSAAAESLQQAKNNIDHWLTLLNQGAEAIIITASGCGSHIKDYPALFIGDAQYAPKAQQVAESCKDISEFMQAEDMSYFKKFEHIQSVAWHPPCTLQHGQQLGAQVENMLTTLGYRLVSVKDQHLCCGSAGTYSILQAELSTQLLNNKIKHLQHQQPDVIATANIGCQSHLLTQSTQPVLHWLQLLDFEH